MTARHLIVTGGTGYIGSRLVDRALTEQRKVTLLGRSPGPVGARHINWTLGAPLPPDALDPALPANSQALIHLAHDWQDAQDRNIEGTADLFASAAVLGIRARVFISSQSARAEALNRYGRMKWSAEQRLADAVSLRVGLVYGGPRQAMYGLLCKLARLPVLPMIEPKRAVQPIHLDEVVAGILAAADSDLTGVLALAGTIPQPFGETLQTLAVSLGGHRLRVLPVPLRLALFACDLSARLPLLPTVDRERVLGLAGTEPIDSAADLARLGIELRPLAARLAEEPAGRHATLEEGRAFIRHAGVVPSSALLRRYARAMPLGAMARPHFGLRWREPLGGRSELGRRMRIASRIAEASLAGERALTRSPRAVRLARLVAEGVLEALLLAPRLVATLASR